MAAGIWKIIHSVISYELETRWSRLNKQPTRSHDLYRKNIKNDNPVVSSLYAYKTNYKIPTIIAMLIDHYHHRPLTVDKPVDAQHDIQVLAISSLPGKSNM